MEYITKQIEKVQPILAEKFKMKQGELLYNFHLYEWSSCFGR